jgi:signal peptidase
MTDEESGHDGGDPPAGSGEGPADPPADGDNTSSERGQSATAGDGRPPDDDQWADESQPPDDDQSRHTDQSGDDDRVDPDAGVVTRFRTSEWLPVVLVRETLSSALIVAVVGIVLFAISGIWPPMVAVESGSMEPHMQKGDLVFVTEPGRFAPDAGRGETGVVTHEVGSEEGYSSFGEPGSVVVYRQPGRLGPPIIHRARFFVEEGENWYDRANPDYLPGDSCETVPNCPAPNAGFLTKGDNNGMYDQVNAIGAPPVKPSWISGVARVRIPLLGWIRLVFSGAATTTPPPVDAGIAAGAGGVCPVESRPATQPVDDGVELAA